jgi:hypothetical protein
VRDGAQKMVVSGFKHTLLTGACYENQKACDQLLELQSHGIECVKGNIAREKVLKKKDAVNRACGGVERATTKIKLLGK